MKRNYTGNVLSTDRWWYYHPAGTYDADGEGTHPTIEYNATPGSANPHEVEGGTYVRNNTVTIEVTWRNDNTFPVSGTVQALTPKLMVPNPTPGNPTARDTVNLTVSPSGTTNVSLAANGGTASVTYTLSGVPNYVVTGDLDVSYQLLTTGNGSNYLNLGALTTEYLCVADASPTGIQAIPWVEFMQHACRWAHGSSGNTTVREEMTRGMNRSRRDYPYAFTYSPMAGPQFLQYNEEYGEMQLKLRKFLLDLEDSTYPGVTMQCNDFAQVLAAATNAVGHGSHVHYLEPLSPHTEFITHGLCPPQRAYTNAGNYEPYQFSFHMVTGDSAATTANRYDSTASYLIDYNGDAWFDVAFNWPMVEFWQIELAGYYFGLVHGDIIPTRTPYPGVLDEEVALNLTKDADSEYGAFAC